MPACSTLVGVPKVCGDNNLGAIKKAYIIDAENIVALTVISENNPDTDGTVTFVQMVVGSNFEEFDFPKDTSSISQEMTVDMVGDTHSWSQTMELGLRRFDLRKRNAILKLAEGRRNLVAIAKDNNDDLWMLGSDQGLRLSGNSSTSNNTRAAGQAMTIVLTTENERHMWYKVSPLLMPALLLPAVD